MGVAVQAAHHSPRLPRRNQVRRFLAWLRSLFGRPDVPPVLGHVRFVTDPQVLAHVVVVFERLLADIERVAPQLIVHETWEGRLAYYDYDHFPEPNRGAFAVWFQDDRVIVGLGKGPMSDTTLRHELAHDILNDPQHPAPVFRGSPPQLSV